MTQISPDADVRISIALVTRNPADRIALRGVRAGIPRADSAMS